MKLSFLLAPFVGGFLLSGTAAAQSGVPANASQAQPWVADRGVGEGVGIAAGGLEIHPGVSGEFGYDSNFFQRSSSAVEQNQFGPVAESLRLRITPQLSLRSLDRRISAAGDAGEDKRPLTFEATGSASYNEFFALDSADSQEFNDSRNVQGGGGLLLNILPGRVFSGSVSGAYAYVFDPSNQGGLTSNFSRNVINVGADVSWAPGGGAFEWSLLNYGTAISLFDVPAVSRYDNNNHQFTTSGRWKFLPKTAVLYDATVSIIRYGSTATLNDGDTLQTRVGLSGLLSKRLGLMVMGGWALSGYQNQNGLPRNYDDFLANAEVQWYVTSGNEVKREGFSHVGASTLSVGYARTFQDGYLSDYFQSDRGYAKFSYLIGGMILTTAQAGVALINYPDFLLEGSFQQGFQEARLDLQGFAEYRPLDTVGINIQLQYDEAFSQTLTAPTYTDDLSYSRFRAFLGARWFM